MLPTKIVVIGAGSASFGLSTLATLLSSQRLRGSTIALVDHNRQALSQIGRLADRLNREWQAGMTVTTHVERASALPEADFVVLAIEVAPREALWKMDYEIPLKYGVRQPYAENGGPGGFAHAARNIGPVMAIVRDMEQLCPEAWLINFTNPMIRICDAVARYSDIQVVGLCHQINMGYAMVGRALVEDLGFMPVPGFSDSSASELMIPLQKQMTRQALARLEITAAGLNHFTWMLDLRDKETGADLYPRFAERWAAMEPEFEPLSRDIYQIFELFPIPGDEHLCEYLPWLSDPLRKAWERYDLSLYEWEAKAQRRESRRALIAGMGAGEIGVESLRNPDSEGALEIIENIAGAGSHYHPAVNLPNRGYIANLPDGAIVEVPGLVNGFGVQGLGVGPLPEAIAELCRRELAVVRLGVDAAVNGDRQAALQSLLLDPVMSDIGLARQILDDYLLTYREHLPQFW
jgi:alpha-galactosidase